MLNFVDKALNAQKPAIPILQIAASAPPAIIKSALSVWINLNESPIACAPEAHAVTVEWLGPLRLYLIARLSGISKIYHYPFFSKKFANFYKTAKEFTEKTLNTEVNPQSKIYCNNNDVEKAKKKYNITNEKITLHIIIFIK